MDQVADSNNRTCDTIEARYRALVKSFRNYTDDYLCGTMIVYVFYTFSLEGATYVIAVQNVDGVMLVEEG